MSVQRPTAIKYSNEISLPNFKIESATFPVVPRDQYFAYGSTIYQTYTSMPDRYFDSFSYYEIFKEYFDKGMNWISQPPPILKNFEPNKNWWCEGEYRYENILKEKILWHTATFFKCGDSIIYNHKGPGSKVGLEWMQRNMSANYIENKDTYCKGFGHIDHGFFMIDDETVIGLSDWIPNCLKNKNVIIIDDYIQKIPASDFGESYQKYEGKYSYEWLSVWLTQWRGYLQDVCFDTNVLVVDSNNIIFTNSQPKLFKELEKRNINCIVCPIRHGLFWEAGIHCLTLDVSRRGEKRTIVN